MGESAWRIKSGRFCDAKTGIRQNAESYQIELNSLSDELARQYENYVNGHLPRDRFVALKKSIGEEKKKLEDKLTAIEREKTEAEMLNSDISRVVNYRSALQKKEIISAKVVDALVESVYVYAQDKLEIKFRFEDLYEKAITSV